MSCCCFGPRHRSPKCVRAGDVSTAFRWACENGDTELAQWLVACSAFSSKGDWDQAFYATAVNGLPDMARWLVDVSGEAARNHALGWACRRGHIGAAKWLVSTLDVGPETIRQNESAILRKACAEGQVEVVRWLVSHFRLDRRDVCARDGFAIRRARENGHLRMVAWLTHRFTTDDDDDDEHHRHRSAQKVAPRV